VTYDLPPAIQTAVREIAAQLGCSQSDVVAHLLAFGLQAYHDGRLDLHSQRQSQTFALRFSHKLRPPTLPTELPAVEPLPRPHAEGG
jgi:hypothetical protein